MKHRIFCAHVLLSVGIPLSASAATGNSDNAFNPAIGLILEGGYNRFASNPDDYAIPGFALGDETGPGERGFTLGESELAISANIDPQLYGSFTGAIAPDGGFDVENAYFQTLGLGHGLTLRGGRFFSAIGYMNEQHAHVWDFVDTALPYRAMLANQYGDDGVQLRLLAPTELFVEFGAEAFRGASFPAGGAADHGKGTITGFVHLGGDVGDSNSWTAGLSHLRAKADDRETANPYDPDNPDVFSGTSNLTIADFVWKWAPNGNPYKKNFKLQTEAFYGTVDGTFDVLNYEGIQGGGYVQAIYQFRPRWRTGVRYDRLYAKNRGATFNGTVLDTQDHTPQRVSLMVDYSNSEFSRFRLQYNRDESQPQVDNEWFLQYIVSLGAHGAHQF